MGYFCVTSFMGGPLFSKKSFISLQPKSIACSRFLFTLNKVIVLANNHFVRINYTASQIKHCSGPKQERGKGGARGRTCPAQNIKGRKFGLAPSFNREYGL